MKPGKMSIQGGTVYSMQQQLQIFFTASSSGWSMTRRMACFHHLALRPERIRKEEVDKKIPFGDCTLSLCFHLDLKCPPKTM
jgi:hypothetical protein